MTTNSHIGEQHAATDSDEISFKEILLKIQEWFRYLWSKKILVIGVGFLGAILGFFYVYVQRPDYTAITTFVLEDDTDSGTGQYAGLASMVGINLGNSGSLFHGENIVKLYQSRNMISQVLLSKTKTDTTLSLLDYYFKINTEDNAKTGLHLTEGFVGRNRDSILGNVVSDIKANYLKVSKPDKLLSIINVEVKSKDEIFAKEFNDRLVEKVNEFYIQTKVKKSMENIRILEKKVDSVRKSMTGAVSRSASIADATPNLNPTRQAQRNAPIQIAQFSSETSKAILSELIKNLEMTKISLLKETPLIQIVDMPVYPLDKMQKGKLKFAVLGALLGGVLLSVFLVFRLIFLQALK